MLLTELQINYCKKKNEQNARMSLESQYGNVKIFDNAILKQKCY